MVAWPTRIHCFEQESSLGIMACNTHESSESCLQYGCTSYGWECNVSGRRGTLLLWSSPEEHENMNGIHAGVWTNLNKTVALLGHMHEYHKVDTSGNNCRTSLSQCLDYESQVTLWRIAKQARSFRCLAYGKKAPACSCYCIPCINWE